MKIVKDLKLDEERALYGRHDLKVVNVAFDGPADGESALKECTNIEVERCFCNLRYPFWHVHGLKITHSELTVNCRASLWYSDDIEVRDTKLHGPKAFRECARVKVENCDIDSPEFGWSVDGFEMTDCTVTGSEYFLMRSNNIKFKNVTFNGKYPCQYIENAEFVNCRFDSKDSFWHAKNVVIKDSVIRGEYIGWYSENLTFINCTVIGTQPLCYCKGLKLINCKCEQFDFAFEKSETEAEILTEIISIRDPYKGTIRVKGVGEIERNDPKSDGVIIVTG